MSLRKRLAVALGLAFAVPLGVGLLVARAPLSDEVTILAVAVPIGVAVAVGVSRALARPVRDIATAAERVANGEETALPPPGDDEIGRLAQALAQISENLRRRVADVEASRDEVRASVRRLGEALRSTHDLRKILSVVLETALVAVGGKSGAVYLLSASRSELYVKVGRHLDPAMAQRRIPLGEGLAGWVGEQRQGVRLPSVADAPVPADPEPVEPTALAVPLESRSQLLGVLAIYGRTTGEAFREEDLETILSLARQAGVGIENVLLHDEAKRLSITDGLTGIANHRYFQMRLAQEFERALRFQRPLSLLVIDIDRFKQVNDRHGHMRGDATLIELAGRLHSHTRREVDTVARYGGEEFVLILPETGVDGARVVAEKIRNAIGSRPFGSEGEEAVAITVSVGYATYPEHGVTPQVLLHAADQAMYRAKQRGRDRVVGADDLSQPTLARPRGGS